ncbi:MAG TPA: hypothetical protein PKA36_11165, partial [Pseudoxanthomonas mexicana]|nr:hypothetical protein [Pseudoxanthomonas mexicana]
MSAKNAGLMPGVLFAASRIATPMVHHPGALRRVTSDVRGCLQGAPCDQGRKVAATGQVYAGAGCRIWEDRMAYEDVYRRSIEQP